MDKISKKQKQTEKKTLQINKFGTSHNMYLKAPSMCYDSLINF